MESSGTAFVALYLTHVPERTFFLRLTLHTGTSAPGSYTPEFYYLKTFFRRAENSKKRKILLHGVKAAG